MRLNSILTVVATLGPLGYLPARGTLASVLAALVLYVCPLYSLSLVTQCICALGTMVISYILCRVAVQEFHEHDPAPVVIDEVCGMMITYIGTPYDPIVWVVGFVLFRFFDITKIMGIRAVEKLGQGCGVLLDDVVAGIYSMLVLHALLYMGIFAWIHFAIFWIRDTILR